MRTVREVTASTDFVIFASDLQWPFGVNWGFTRPNATREFGGLSGMDGWDVRDIKSVHQFYVYFISIIIANIYIHLHVVKNVTNIFLGFKI